MLSVTQGRKTENCGFTAGICGKPNIFCAMGDSSWFQTFVVSAFPSYVDSKISRALLRSSEILVSY